MKSSFIATCLVFVATLVGHAQTTTPPSVIPIPQSMTIKDGVFHIHPGKSGRGVTKIYADEASLATARFLSASMEKSVGKLAVVKLKSGAAVPANSILITSQGAAADLGEEGYELSITTDSVSIRAPGQAGLFHGEQTFLQLLPPQVFASQKNAEGISWDAPCVEIKDAPRFQWRGMMLDVARHFFTVPEVHAILDGMALHKMNVFHWHLVDDQGWRIEIKKYPLLTEKGAWRQSIGFKLDPKSSTAYGPDGRYGGFYTQAQIREVVKYASARHITIVPEIEMPGHACAALVAYPQYSCTGGPFTTDLPGGVFNGIYCAGNDEAFEFVQNILSEVLDLFPGKYIHVGGDEVLEDNWKNCPKCKARIASEHLAGPQDLESYFIRRVEKYVNSRGRTLVGWSEIRTGGLAQNAVVMDWVGGATEAATAGHDVVMSPLADCYFDHYQSLNQAQEPHAIGGYLPLKQVYAFEPVPATLKPEFQSHILGAQANVWTEYMPSLNHVEYMAFPRLCALSEVLWSPKASLDFDAFSNRLEPDLLRLEKLGINYRHAKPEPEKAETTK